jgi:hypothetical protein
LSVRRQGNRNDPLSQRVDLLDQISEWIEKLDFVFLRGGKYGSVA